MRILLDECVNPRGKAAFPNHEAKTVIDMAWRGATNGELLAQAEAHNVTVFVTIDQSLRYQQNLAARKLGFVVVKVPDNNIKFYRPLFNELNEAAESVNAGQVIHIYSPLSPP